MTEFEHGMLLVCFASTMGAEEQPPVVDEGADRSDIAGGVQYRHLRLYQVANRIQELVSMQVGRPQYVLAYAWGVPPCPAAFSRPRLPGFPPARPFITLTAGKSKSQKAQVFPGVFV